MDALTLLVVSIIIVVILYVMATQSTVVRHPVQQQTLGRLAAAFQDDFPQMLSRGLLRIYVQRRYRLVVKIELDDSALGLYRVELEGGDWVYAVSGDTVIYTPMA